MIDNFALGLTHLLLAIGLWRVLMRSDLDTDPDAPPPPPPRLRGRFRRRPVEGRGDG